MKTWQIIGFIAVLIIGIVFTSGCTSSASQAQNVGITQTLSSVVTPTPIYQYGDIVHNNATGKSKAIVDTHEPGKYLVLGVVSGTYVGEWSVEDGNYEYMPVTEIESNYTKIGWAAIQVKPVATSTPTSTTTTKISEESLKIITDDGKFLNYYTSEGIGSDITALRMSSKGGVCDQALAVNINKKLVASPKPGSTTLQKYRTMLMNAMGAVDGQSSDYSRLEDHLNEASKVFVQYNQEVDTMLGVSTPSATIGAEYSIIKSSTGNNILNIKNKMNDQRRFILTYDTYNGAIKTSNNQVSTATLNPGETGQVSLYCSACTGISLTGMVALNQTSMTNEQVTFVEVKS